jgi:DNA-binding SARP family transcriptional activator
MMDYALLGPLEARGDEGLVELPGGKPRALLALLLLEGGRAVPVESLLVGLWEKVPPSAHKVLQAHVSQLRKALGAEAIETRPPGYLLRPGSLDLSRFEALAESARSVEDPARRAQLYREALALWRGPALAEFRREPFAVAATRRLAELRLEVIGRRVEAELALGEHERLVPELQVLVESEPLREQLRAQLMLALYRCGRQAEALACYREARRLLVEGLGIEPGPALQELERAILRHDVPVERTSVARGAVVCAGSVPVELFAPLAGDERELLLVELVADPTRLGERSSALERKRASVGASARTACFTSTDPGADLARFAEEQEAELLVVDTLDPALLVGAPCDVAVASGGRLFERGGPILVPFGGGREEWAALELAAWLARAHGLPLRLVGVEGGEGRRDASRMLAGASLVLQRFAGMGAETAIVAPGAEGILSEPAAAIVVSLARSELDPVRRALSERAEVPVLFVHSGLRPGGLAPDRTLTRFSWSLAES